MTSLLFHRLQAAPIAAGCLLFIGCGGGSSPAATAQLHGHLVSRDGSTANLAGVEFFLIGSGRTVTTGTDGAFSFGTVPVGTIGLRIVDPAAPLYALAAPPPLSALSGSDDDASEAEDSSDSDGSDDGDSNDIGDDDFDVSQIGNDEDVEVKVGIEDGKVVSLDMSHSGHLEREAEVRLTRSVESDDADVEGSAKLESRDDGERLKVEAEHLTPGRAVELFVIDGLGADESMGIQIVGLDFHAEWEISDAALPFGALTVEDLLGFGIEVRDSTGSPVLLFGNLPAELPNHADDGTVDDGREGGSSLLTPALGVTGQARVEVRSRPDEGREDFRVEAEHLVAGTLVNVLLENPALPGTLTLIGTFTIGAEGEGEMELDTHDGDTLPYGVTSVSLLVGMDVELRVAGTSALLFSGLVPAMVAD